jgi:hypothetical protein
MLSSTNDQKLRLIFFYYCAYGLTGSKQSQQDTIDSSNFMKLIRESPGLLDSYHRIAGVRAGVNPTDVDMAFVKAKDKHGRRLNYGQFLCALDRLAQIKYPDDRPWRLAVMSCVTWDCLRACLVVCCAPHSLGRCVWQAVEQSRVPL